MKEMTKIEALNVLIETAHAAQKSGSITLDFAVVVHSAIIVLKEAFKPVTVEPVTTENPE